MLRDKDSTWKRRHIRVIITTLVIALCASMVVVWFNSAGHSPDPRVAPVILSPAIIESPQQTALEELLTRLEQTSRSLAACPGYTCLASLQERVDGQLGESQTVELKCRHEPFSVYLKWTRGPVGREMIYVEGQNDGLAIVHPGGIRGRIVPRIAMELDNRIITAERRYPISEFGLLRLTEKLLEIVSRHSDSPEAMTCSVHERVEFDGRSCATYVIEHSDPKFNDVYRKAIVLMDDETSIPVSLLGFGWSEESTEDPQELDNQTLIESYQYTQVDFENIPVDADFDETNPSYRFRR